MCQFNLLIALTRIRSQRIVEFSFTDQILLSSDDADDCDDDDDKDGNKGCLRVDG